MARDMLRVFAAIRFGRRSCPEDDQRSVQDDADFICCFSFHLHFTTSLLRDCRDVYVNTHIY
jgi:hypothetical protein